MYFASQIPKNKSFLSFNVVCTKPPVTRNKKVMTNAIGDSKNATRNRLSPLVDILNWLPDELEIVMLSLIVDFFPKILSHVKLKGHTRKTNKIYH